MKYLHVVVETDALGHKSGKVYNIPLSELEEKSCVHITLLLPSHYLEFVERIDARLAEDKKSVEIISAAYGDGVLPIEGTGENWHSRAIGLNYASCVIDISIIDKEE